MGHLFPVWLFAAFTAAFPALPTSATENGVVNEEKSQYKLLISNHTKWFVIVHVDGKRLAMLSPQTAFPNAWDGSLVKHWLKPGLHRVVAFAYESRKDVLNDKPAQKTNEAAIEVSLRLQNGVYIISNLEIREENFEPWTTPAYRNKPNKH